MMTGFVREVTWMLDNGEVRLLNGFSQLSVSRRNDRSEDWSVECFCSGPGVPGSGRVKMLPKVRIASRPFFPVPSIWRIQRRIETLRNWTSVKMKGRLAGCAPGCFLSPGLKTSRLPGALRSRKRRFCFRVLPSERLIHIG